MNSMFTGRRALHQGAIPLLLLLLLLSATFAAAAPDTTGDAGAPTPAAHDEATLFPVPDYSGDFATRAALTGDWAGFRQQLADDGIQFEFKLNQYYQGVSGGRPGRGDWEYNGTSDYRIKIDTGKAGWWPGGFIEIHGESYYGQTVNGNTGSLMPVNIDPILSAPAGAGTYLSHVVFTQFLAENFAVFAGKLDTTVGDGNSFAHGNGDEKFQNLAFSVNPTLLAVGPYSTLGAGFLWIPAEGVVLATSVYDLEGEINTSGLDDVWEDSTGYSTELTIATRFFDKPGHQLFGGIYGDGDFIALTQDPRILVPPLGVAPVIKNESWSAYYNFEQYLVHDPDTGSGWGIFGRVGVADKATNIIPLFLSAGLGGTGLLPSRENDRFGAGFYYLEVSDARPGPLLDDSEQGVEFFYDVEVAPWFHLAASLQFIEPALRAADTATVLGFRSTITF